MGEVKRWYPDGNGDSAYMTDGAGQCLDSHDEPSGFARGTDYARLERERDELAEELEATEEELEGCMEELTRLRAVEAAAKDALSKFASLRCELYDLRGEYDETAALFGAWQQRAEQSESERDEARECVKRLSEIGEHAKTFIGTFIGEQPNTGRSHYAGKLWDQLDVALAATPEHLRNA